MKSFGLLRTNTGLSTNMKLIISDNYDLFIESIDSTTELSSTKFKKVRFNKENYFDEMIPFFYKDLPSEIAFSIKYSDDNDNLLNSYTEQYDDIYQMGARNITDNKNYKEEYEFFAPLYFTKGNFPKYFAIFRVDGPGLINLVSNNFKSEIINKLKCIKMVDLTNTSLGEWIDKNFLRNDIFPDTPLEVDFRTDEFTKWNGIDYDSGGYTHKSLFMNDNFEYENAIFDLEKFIFDGYQKNKVVFPNILNFSFLFDDTPATPTSLRKWSINRYFGFYLEDIDQTNVISPYSPAKLKQNIYMDPSNRNTLRCSSSTYPFDDNKSDSDFSKKDYYIEYLGNFYKVEQYSEALPSSIGSVNIGIGSKVTTEQFNISTEFRYRVICDIDLTGKESLFNKNICVFDDHNYIKRLFDDSYFNIEDFDTADVWLIEVDGKYHNLIKDTNGIKLNTDYAFRFSVDKYSYFINSVDESYTKSVNLSIDNNKPETFKIFRIRFSDIKDFDTSIINTEFSKYEYEKNSEITKTDETKLYFPDLRSKSYPSDNDDYIYKGNFVNIPTSSEYTSNLETFRIVNNDLSDIWRKNPVHSRWGFQNSLSANDYPYLLNNSEIFEDYNRTVNPFDPIPSRIERNLDYFYTINSSTHSYTHHSLHVEDHINRSLNKNFKFELSKYLNTGTYLNGTVSTPYTFDYFSYFFGKKSELSSGKVLKNTTKYSRFNKGDNDIPNVTLFRGIKLSVFDVDNIKYDNGVLTNINLKNSDRFDDYKFSILLSDNKTIGVDNMSTNCFSYSISIIPQVNFPGTPESPAAVWDDNDLLYTSLEPVDQLGGWFLNNTVNTISSTPEPNKFKILDDNLSFIQEYVLDNFYLSQSYNPYPMTVVVFGTSVVSIEVGDSVTMVGCTTSINYVGSIINSSGNSYITLVDGNGNPSVFTESCSGSICITHITQTNDMDWLIIDEWDSRQAYATGSVVVHDDILYQSNTNVGPVNLILRNSVAPFVYNQWMTYTHSVGVTYSLLWNPNFDSLYTPGSIVYNSGEYYVKGTGSYSFWNPYVTYSVGSVSLYKNDFWISMTGSNSTRPSSVTSRIQIVKKDNVSVNSYDISNWNKKNGYESSCIWKIINLWDVNKTYSSGDLVVHDNVVYTCILQSVNNITSNIKYWSRRSSIKPDTNIIYKPNNNPVILMSEKYYIIKSNDTNSTLKNGINIYINHKWKNILINIAIDDNTIKNLSNTDRDDLYNFALYQRDKIYSSDGLDSPVNTKLTAINFINCINDITNAHGFTDLLTYTVINEDGTIKTYDYNNLIGLNHLIKCDFPDEFNIKVDSLKKESEISPPIISNRTLEGGLLNDINNINYYNKLIPAYKITKTGEFRTSDNTPHRIMSKNTHGIINIIDNTVYRHSGYYMPIFYDIELFKRPGLTTSTSGNYIFDTSLTNFGKMKQRVISKVNTDKNVLKLKDRKDYKSIYPMLDEFGYTVVDFFIFKSTWDFRYHIKCGENINTSNNVTENIINTINKNNKD